MKELSLNILDIAENSVSAKATLIEVAILESVAKNVLEIKITDNGCGMSEEFLKTVADPFSTTRKTRKVGMGISLLKLAAEQSGGKFEIKSTLGKGTVVTALFEHNHIDRPPLGDIGQTISALVSCNLDIDFIYRHSFEDNTFSFSTKEVVEMIPDVPLNTPDVVLWMQDYINEGIANVSSKNVN